ncbi:VMAP-C domain-containing protein [Streptomyces sp. NPDC004069]
MKTGAEFGEHEDDPRRARGLELVLRLTDALCELGCMEDAQGRVQFAAVLGDQLHRQVDVRGVRLREDVATLVRVALSVSGGEHVLVGVVRILEGAAAGDELDRVIAPAAPMPGPQTPPGPLSRDDEKSARIALARGGLPSVRLRDELVGELGGLDLPTGLSPDQLFTHLLEWNAQPDELPPTVLLLDRAARLAGTPDHRAALTGWVDDWAARSGHTAEVAARRAERATVVNDPDIPRCLVVAVEPAGDGTLDVVVRTWLNSAPGHWNPQPAEPVTTTLEGLGPAVERSLRQGARLWTDQNETGSSGGQQPPYVEFVLPYDLLNHDVAGLTLRIGDGRPLPLGLRYGVHLRSLERMRTDDEQVRHQWQERWRILRTNGVTVHGWSEPDGRRIDAWQTALAGEARHTAVVLDAPAGESALAALKAAIAEGIGLAVWDRRGSFAEERREVVTAVFASVPVPARIPTAIHRLRRQAELNTRGQHLLLGRHIGFFWDDPTRVVDIHTTGTGDLATEEAPA